MRVGDLVFCKDINRTVVILKVIKNEYYYFFSNKYFKLKDFDIVSECNDEFHESIKSVVAWYEERK